MNWDLLDDFPLKVNGETLFSWEEANKYLQERGKKLPSVKDFKQLCREGYTYISDIRNLIIGNYNLVLPMPEPIRNMIGDPVIETTYLFWTSTQDEDSGMYYKICFKADHFSFILSDDSAQILGVKYVDNTKMMDYSKKLRIME